MKQEILNNMIYDLNQNILAKEFNLDRQIMDKNKFKQYFYKWCLKENTKFQKDIIKFMKDKFSYIKNFENCTDKNIVYIYTFKNKIVYIGESKFDYQTRLFDFGYDDQLFGQFSSKCDFMSKNKDWKFYIYKAKKHQDIKQLESYLINWFVINGYPTLNVKCEDISGFFEMIRKGNTK